MKWWHSFLMVFLGSGIGGMMRWIVSRWLNGSHPWGTLTANVIGCLMLGMINAWLSRRGVSYEPLRLLLVVGLCGGFTTFSTFINENFLLLQGCQAVQAIIYISLSIALGLGAVWLGYSIIGK